MDKKVNGKDFNEELSGLKDNISGVGLSEESINSPDGSVSKQDVEDKKKKRLLKLLLIILLVLLSFSIVVAFDIYIKKVKNNGNNDNNGKVDNRPDITVDSGINYGDLEGKTKEEIQAELNKKVEEGMMNVSMNTNIVLNKATDDANVMVTNKESNRYMQFVEIYNDKEELIYKSGGIPVGSSLEKVKLDKRLSKGEHKCVAYFNAYDEKSKSVVGKVGVNVVINVLN